MGPRDGVLLFRLSRLCRYMTLLIFCLIAVSFAISWLVTQWMKGFAVRIGFVDKPGGRKIHANPKPLGGGVGIFWGLALPIIFGLGVVSLAKPPQFLRSPEVVGDVISKHIDAYWSGARLEAPLGW